jgi:hypothetical protein
VLRLLYLPPAQTFPGLISRGKRQGTEHETPAISSCFGVAARSVRHVSQQLSRSGSVRGNSSRNLPVKGYTCVRCGKPSLNHMGSKHPEPFRSRTVFLDAGLE